MEPIRHYRSIFLLEGFLLILLGAIAIAFPGFSTLSFELFLGWLFIFSGLIQGFRAFKLRHEPNIWAPALNAIFSLILGVLLLVYPISGIVSLTILLVIFFMIEGIVKIVWGIQYRQVINQWGWLIFSGITSLILAGIIWYGWPGTAFWVIGLLVGINLVFFGASLLGIGFSMPKINKPDQF